MDKKAGNRASGKCFRSQEVKFMLCNAAEEKNIFLHSLQ